MKKTLAILTALILLVLCSCGGEKPAANEELRAYVSDNGYTVSYPAEFTYTALSEAIDFTVMDTDTGSSVTILTEERNDASKLSEDELAAERKTEGMKIDITSFKSTEINGTPAIQVEYNYNECKVTEIIYDGGDKAFRATYTELPGTKDDLRDSMINIISSLEVE